MLFRIHHYKLSFSFLLEHVQQFDPELHYEDLQLMNARYALANLPIHFFIGELLLSKRLCI